ncbi:hypothetical protein K469DRAFT_696234 [Zopfia rhizophila CBS 207.26]|uniref:Uncharacterized protein n=1 Tax=Zopfia rhizophila CBS 207.26 TaxID=1314779 RepID=A0A6A6DJT4_9PEZI|nr:hypothetical protein K469DRAFT_696234 [Zopfia rhizophila CBS 207.26]
MASMANYKDGALNYSVVELEKSDSEYGMESPKSAKTVIAQFKEIFIHVVAITSTLAILVADYLEVYWLDLGAVSSSNKIRLPSIPFLSQSAQLKYSQFAAKVLEIVVMTSSSTLIFYLYWGLLRKASY